MVSLFLLLVGLSCFGAFESTACTREVYTADFCIGIYLDIQIISNGKEELIRTNGSQQHSSRSVFFVYRLRHACEVNHSSPRDYIKTMIYWSEPFGCFLIVMLTLHKVCLILIM